MFVCLINWNEILRLFVLNITACVRDFETQNMFLRTELDFIRLCYKLEIIVGTSVV
jgi:hypothetical protein